MISQFHTYSDCWFSSAGQIPHAPWGWGWQQNPHVPVKWNHWHHSSSFLYSLWEMPRRPNKSSTSLAGVEPCLAYVRCPTSWTPIFDVAQIMSLGLGADFRMDFCRKRLNRCVFASVEGPSSSLKLWPLEVWVIPPSAWSWPAKSVEVLVVKSPYLNALHPKIYW